MDFGFVVLESCFKIIKCLPTPRLAPNTYGSHLLFVTWQESFASRASLQVSSLVPLETRFQLKLYELLYNFSVPTGKPTHMIVEEVPLVTWLTGGFTLGPGSKELGVQNYVQEEPAVSTNEIVEFGK
jgi:hypothetical protein